MKTFVLVLVLCAVGTYAAITDAQKAKVTEFKRACVIESGVAPDVLENTMKGVFDEKDPKLACFSACLLKNLGFLNPNGSFNEANFRATVPPDVPKDKVDEILKKCGSTPTQGGSFCENGGKILKCYLENKTIPLFR